MTGWRNYQTDSPEYKREVLDRIRKARAEGVPTGRIAEVCGEEIGLHIIYDMMEAKVLPHRMWELVDKGLKKLGY